MPMQRGSVAPEHIPSSFDMYNPQISRRSFLRVGTSLGALLSLPDFAAARERIRTKALILFLSGGIGSKPTVQPDPLHLRTGQAVPLEYRGPFRSIPAANDTRFGELFPNFAGKSNRMSIIRSFYLRNAGDHGVSMQKTMMSQDTSIAFTIGQRMSSPNGAPLVHMNTGRSTFAPAAFAESNAYKPMYDHDRSLFFDPSTPEGIAAAQTSSGFGFDDDDEEEEVPMPLRERITERRQQDRRDLLSSLQQQSRLDTPETRRMEAFQERAFNMTRGGGVFQQALRMRPEDRRRFGDSLVGDMSLTALQFLEHAGVAVVHYEPDFVSFDTHTRHEQILRNLAPPVDRAIAALSDACRERGITLMITSEMNRTPRMNDRAGRDHFPRGTWLALQGPNVREGFVYGSCDYTGEFTENPVQQEDTLPNTMLYACGFPYPVRQSAVTEIGR